MYPYEEVNRTKPSPSVSVPWFKPCLIFPGKKLSGKLSTNTRLDKELWKRQTL